MYYWDGGRWISTLSPDGRYRWDGQTWRAVAVAPSVSRREQTSWTQPLRYTVAGWYCLLALYAVSLSVWMKWVVGHTAGGDPLSGGTTAGLLIGNVLGIALAAVAIVGAIKTWSRVYNVLLVLLGLGLLSPFINLIQNRGTSLLPAYTGLYPMWVYWGSVAASFLGGCLGAWMLAALRRYGPWGIRSVR